MSEAEIISKLNDLLRRVKSLESQNNCCCHCHCHKNIIYPQPYEPYSPFTIPYPNYRWTLCQSSDDTQ